MSANEALSRKCPEAYGISCRCQVCAYYARPLPLGLWSGSRLRPQHPTPVFSFCQLRYLCFLSVFHLFLMLRLIHALWWYQSAWCWLCMWGRRIDWWCVSQPWYHCLIVSASNNHQMHELISSVSDDVMAHHVPGEPREMFYVLLY
jgi:hypothetical protein